MATPHVLALIGAHLVMSLQNESMSSASDMAERFFFCYTSTVSGLNRRLVLTFLHYFFLEKGKLCFLPQKSPLVP